MSDQEVKRILLSIAAFIVKWCSIFLMAGITISVLFYGISYLTHIDIEWLWILLIIILFIYYINRPLNK